MSGMTLQEAKDQLITVNQAIADILAGKAVNQLRVGSGEFQRLYNFEKLDLGTLREYRNELLAIINSLENTLPVFKKNATIPLVVGKDLYHAVPPYPFRGKY